MPLLFTVKILTSSIGYFSPFCHLRLADIYFVCLMGEERRVEGGSGWKILFYFLILFFISFVAIVRDLATFLHFVYFIFFPPVLVN